MKGKRHRAREVALQILFLMEAQEVLTERGLATYFSYFNTGAEGEDGDAPAIDPESRAFTEMLVRGVNQHREALDAEIVQAAHHWRLDRMNRVDRNILRLAAFELRHCAEIPPRVSLNEAIELAKRFGTAESPSFVNGILDKLAKPSLQAKKP